MSADRSRYRCISATDAVALIRSKPGVALFDVRDLASYQRGHIDGAAHLTEDRFLTWTRRLDKATPVLIYCYHGNASQTYAQMFVDFHFARVFSIDGGYPALEAALSASEPA